MKLPLKILLFYCVLKVINSARILGAFTFPSYSHQIVFQAIWNELANRGHDVVVLTTQALPDAHFPNLKVIPILESKEIWDRRKDLLRGSTAPKDVVSADFLLFGLICEQSLKHPEMQRMIHNDSEHFDLVMVEWLHPALATLSARFKCPLVGVSSLELLDVLSMDIGSPIHPVMNPNFFLPFTKELSLWDRLISIEFSIWLRLHFENVVYPFGDELARKYIGKHLPPVKEIANNLSMVFINSNKLFSKPSANIPTVIEFSGIHVKPPKPLPKDIQSYLDEATNGVIYFSLGSTMKSNMIPKKLKQTILETFMELPYNVLWKLDNHNFTDLSDNIKISNWLPQQDILAHPNVKVFITQGGLQSFEEAIQRKVPLIGIPFIIDQPKNMIKMEQLGLGQVVDKNTLTKESFKKVIIEVVENSNKYRKNAEQLLEFLEDEPMKSLDKVMWWMEYVLRHKGTAHMRSPYLNMPAYQYFFIDVFMLIILCLACAITCSYCILKYTRRLFSQHIKPKVE